MIALKTVIRHRVENQKTKHIAYVAFLVLTTILIIYSIMLLFQDISILGKSEENAFPTRMPTSPSVSSSSDPTDIEIVYPSNDQTANVNSDLEISGISNYNPSSTCHVSVIFNNAKPYKKTIPTGENMENEYSTWKYVIESDSSTIRQGNSVMVVGQSDSERDSESVDKETLTLPIEIGSTPGISSPTIEIDRNTLVELINQRIDDSSEDIKDSIRNSIMSVYAG